MIIQYVLVAKVNVDTAYIKGEIEAQVLPEAIYVLVIANVGGAKASKDANPERQETYAATTRAQAREIQNFWSL